MELTPDLQKMIIEFLSALPTINENDGQQALLINAGLDASLRNVIATGKPARQFVPLLVVQLMNYGKLKDGRHAIEAIIEAAQGVVGTDKQKIGEKLLQRVRTLIQEQKEEEQFHILSQTPVPSLSTRNVQLILEGELNSFDQRKRKDLINVLAALLEIDKQSIKILYVQSGSVKVVIGLSADKAIELERLFHLHREKLNPLREQFILKLLASFNTVREIALLSDTKLFPEAEQFVTHFFQLYPDAAERNKQISQTQIKGLENVLLSADTTELLKQYLNHQKIKGKREEKLHFKSREYYTALFYEKLEKKIRELEMFVVQHNRIFPDANIPVQAQWYCYHLVKEFLQHLIIEYMFRIQSREGG